MNEQNKSTLKDLASPVLSDAEVAASLKQEIIEVYGPVLKVMEKVIAAGFQATVNVGALPTGQMIITQTVIFKNF